MMLGLNSLIDKTGELAYGEYEIYCFNEAVMHRALAEEAARVKEARAASNDDAMLIDPDHGSMSGSWSGTVGELDPVVLARYEELKRQAQEAKEAQASEETLSP